MPNQDWYDEYPGMEDHVTRKRYRRSISAGKRIMDKPSDIVFIRGDDVIPVQTVRIEGRGSTGNQGTRQESNSVTYIRGVTVFGLRGHPELPDLDIEVGDKFGFEGSQYVITGITPHAGEIQAAADRIQP